MAWVAAAVREAQRVRAARVEVEHLYVALLIVGGEAAKVLGSHGITLASARARADELPGEKETAEVPDGPQTEGYWVASDVAKGIVEDSGSAVDTVDLLKRLLREPSNRVRTLVEADGVDSAALYTELRESPGDDYVPYDVQPDPLLREPAFARRMGTFVSAEPEVVVSALLDPAVLRTFAWREGHEVSDDGLVGTKSRRGKRTTLRADVERTTDDGADVVVWTFTALDGRHRDEVTKYERFEVRPLPGGADVVREQGYRVEGFFGQFVHSATKDTGSWDLVFGGHQMAAYVAHREG